MRPAIRTVLLMSGSAGGAYEAEADTLFAAMTAQPSDTRKGHYNTLIKALKDNGIWTKLDVLHVYAAHDAQAARLNIKNPGTYNATAVNSPTFTTDRGYTGDAVTSYLNSNFNPATAGGSYALNNACFACWFLTNIADSNKAIGARISATNDIIQFNPRRTAPNDNMGIGINSDSNSIIGSNVIDSRGLFVLRRTASDAVAVARNGTQIASTNTVSDAIPSLNVYALALNQNGSAVAHDNRQAAALAIGAALTDADNTAFYNALNTYMQAVGAA